MDRPRWYYFLNRTGKRNLVENEKIDDDGLIVGNWSETKHYAVFQNYIDFYDYMCETNCRERCFFEVLLPHHRRKPYFDIDISIKDISSDFCPKNFIEKVKKVILNIIDNPETTILVFNSHTGKKYSYHIVIGSFYLNDYRECEEFFRRTVEKLPKEYLSFFDETVYKNTQQFRMIGSHKYGKDNTKILNKKESHNFVIPSRYQNERGKYLYILYSSLVSKVERCHPLYGFEVKEKEKYMVTQGSATEHDLEDVLKLFREHSLSKEGDFEILNLVEEEGNLVIPLRSHRPYYCEGCKRTHETENPFLTVRGEERTILFDCRRGKNRQFIGKLGLVNMDDKPKKVSPTFEIYEKATSKKTPKRSSPKRFDRLLGISSGVPKKYKPKIDTTLKLSIYA